MFVLSRDRQNLTNLDYIDVIYRENTSNDYRIIFPFVSGDENTHLVETYESEVDRDSDFQGLIRAIKDRVSYYQLLGKPL